jgi:hypothetical protein
MKHVDHGHFGLGMRVTETAGQRARDQVERPPAATQMGRARTVSVGHELTYCGKRHWN